MANEQFDKKQIADLVSKIIGQNVHENYISRKLVLITTLITSLVGVIFADNQVDELEKQKLKSTLDEFMPPGSYMSKLLKPILAGVYQHKTYLNQESITRMASCLDLSEKLLVIGLCYQMAHADGEIAGQEEKYIQAVGRIFKIESSYLSFLSGKDTSQESNHNNIEVEIRALLDPHNFQHLDPAFARAADLLRHNILSFYDNHKVPGNSKAKISYDQLSEFKKLRDSLVEIILNLSELIKESVEQDTLSSFLEDLDHKVTHILEKAGSRNFRIAVVGEFSQGKSTLLNALVGEEIQPTRAIPCSGTVTILRYGKTHKVICRYKDNHEEQVALDDYQKLASMSEEAALSDVSEELSNSTIHEIIFEHPHLELCKNQVEIIDSPGLNEHPNRTIITQQLLQDVDAVIFMANASRLLTQSEKNLFMSIKKQIQGNDLDKPADNIFVVVNFMDLLRNEVNKQQVKQRAHNFLYGSSPLIIGDDRLHFISAQVALDSLSSSQDNQYLDDFKNFVKSVDTFLAQERGIIIVKQIQSKLQNLIEEILANFKQSLDTLEGKIKLSESDQAQVIEYIGDASGWDLKLCCLHDEVLDQSLDLVSDSWEEWLDTITDRIANKSRDWTSQKEDKTQILTDFSNQFINDLSSDLNHWLEQVVKHDILVPQIKKFDESSHDALESIYENLKSIDSISGSNLGEQFNWSLKGFGVDIRFASRLDASSIEDDNLFDFALIGSGGLLGSLLGLLGFGLIPILLGGFAAGAVMSWLFGSSPEDTILKMKQEVYDKGFEKFFESTEEISKKIGQGVVEAINLRYENSKKSIECAISMLNEILQDQEKFYYDTIESKSAKKEFITLKIAEIYELESKLRNLYKS